jgi:putative SOS response-associated peptidase YedK
MCGRFTMATNAEALEERFRAHRSTEVAAPTYNAAPSQAQLTILNDHPDAIVHAAWGFVPEWAAAVNSASGFAEKPNCWKK